MANRNLVKLQAVAASFLLLAGTTGAPLSMAQAQSQAPAQAQTQVQTPAPPQSGQVVSAPGVPNVPEPVYTKPVDLRPSLHDYARPKSHFPNPIAPFTPINVPPPNFTNSQQLSSIIQDGKIYLSLSTAIELALANNYDIAIQRFNLDIADTDIMRAKAGAAVLRGVSAGVVTGTIGGASSTLSGGGGPGGTSLASGGAGSGSAGLVTTTNGAGPSPEYLDPQLTGTIQGERQSTASTGAFSPAANTNTNEYNFGYTQGFTPGANLAVTFNNTRQTSNSYFNAYSPFLSSNFRATLTQHLLQGRGFFINRRFIVQAKRDRQITDSAFRQQVLYTVNQVENIYWGLVSAYEDVQAKERALDQSQQLASDNRKQLEIGTLAPLDVVNADSSVATDKQALVSAQTTLEYQQLVMKQAIARNLSDPVLSTAPVIPTDRVSLDPVPEESEPTEQLVQQAFQFRPEVEQGQLTLKNDELTIRATKNGLLPTLDVYGFYGSATAGGSQSPFCQTINPSGAFIPCPPNTVPTIGYGNVFSNLFNSSNPDKGAGVSMNIILRNRVAQSDQERAQLEYRQSQMKLAQTYIQIRMQVINAQFALTQDRAAVQAAEAAQKFQAQSLDAENKKYRLGASTTANVLQQKRNLATAEFSMITAETTYARDRASLSQILANTLDKYGISLGDAARGTVAQAPMIPGLVPAKDVAPTQMQQQQAAPGTANSAPSTPVTPAPATPNQ
jgi:outer membrane protein